MSARSPEASNGPLTRQAWLALLLIFATGVLIQVSIPTGSDVSWLIVVVERLFDGQQLYVDVIELNPPMSIFLYMPAVVIERLTGLRAETAQIVITTTLAAASLQLSTKIMARAGFNARIEPFIVFGALAFMFLPRATFSEREHIAVMLMLPAFVLASARRRKALIPFSLVVVIGVLAGFGCAIKPHFIGAMALPAAYLALQTRSLRSILWPEYVIAAGIILAYSAVIVLAYPHFINKIVPMVADTYVYVRQPLLTMLFDPLFLSVVGVGLAALILLRRDGGSEFPIVLSLAALGFAFAYLEQGKGWRYHLYPAMALVVILCGTEVASQISSFRLVFHRGTFRSLLRSGAAFAAIVGLAPLFVMHNYTYDISLPFIADIKALAPHPKLFTLSADIGVGHPLVRAVDGAWTGTTCSQFMTRSAKFRRDLPGTDATTKARMETWIAWDRDRIAEALKEGRPDAIVYDSATFDWAELIAARPDIGAMLAGYTKTADANGADLLVRRDLIPRRQSAELTK